MAHKTKACTSKVNGPVGDSCIACNTTLTCLFISLYMKVRSLYSRQKSLIISQLLCCGNVSPKNRTSLELMEIKFNVNDFNEPFLMTYTDDL